MRVIKIILVPTDFSAASKRALRYACDVADAFGASVHIMHVLVNPFAPGASTDTYPMPPDDYLENLDRQARAELEAQLTPEEKVKYMAAFIIRVGAPAQEILQYVRENGAIDLVVMATAGRGGVARLLMGSVADKIVRAAPCPVLTLHPEDQANAELAYRAA